MGDYKPMMTFLIVTLILNVFLVQAYDAFDMTVPVDTETEATGFLGLYTDAKAFFDALSDIPLVPDAVIDVLTLGFFTDYMQTVVMIWYSLPTALFTILFTPLLAGAVYGMIALVLP